MHRLFAPAVFAILALASSSFAQEFSPAVQAQAHAIQAEKASRSPAQSKLDSQLHYLSREAAGLPAVPGAPALKSRVTVEKNGQVIVEISAVPSAELRSAIVGVGGRVIYESVRWSSVSASLPPAVLADFALRADVRRIVPRAQRISHTVTNEAAAAQKVTTVSPQFGVTGAGVKVGVISNSDDHSEESVAAGELPDFTVLPGRSGRPASGEGTAMSEIVHDLAPGASIFFASCGDSKAFMADSILALKAKGCKVIVDDISFGGEWQFQDDEIGQAINQVVLGGALYLSSSGNEGNLKHGNSTTWEGDFLDGGALALLPGGTVHNFKTAQTPQNFNRLLDHHSGVELQWSDEYHTSANDYDLYILNAAGTAIVASSTNKQTGSTEPIERVEDVKPGERIVIWKATAAAPRYLRISCTGSKIDVQTQGQTIGHAATANCICVAAADASKAAPGAFNAGSVTEDSSSDGPHQMFYMPDGTPFTADNFLRGGGRLTYSPTLTAGDGGQTSVTGFKPFYGTSAAAPAAAAIAALVWEHNPGYSNVNVRSTLEATCLDIEDVGFDYNSGRGILMADRALAFSANPEIVVEQPDQTNLVTGSSRSFGSVAVGATGTLTFIVRDVSDSVLSNVAASITGPDQADFSIPTAPSALVAESISTAVTVLFQPTTPGLKNATLHIASSDADESDFTVALSGLAPDVNSIAVGDTVTATTGATRYRPLANDKKSSDPLYISSVSDPSIIILYDYRTLLIPEGFVGTFIYTATDGTTSGDAVVTVVAGTPVAAPKAWNGLLYDNGGFIGGALKLTLTRGTLSGTLNLGTGKVTFSVPKFAGSATRNTTLGSLTVTRESTGRMTVDLQSGIPYTGSLRPAKTLAVKEQLNIILAADDPTVPGGAYATAQVTVPGAVTVAGKLPDGRAFTAGSVLADNDSFIVYSVIAGTTPKAIVAGEFSKANLARTDVTGELEWELPKQTTGLHEGGLFTILTGNGSDYTLSAVLPAGPGTLSIAGGDLAADSTGATTVTAGKPTLTSLLKAWTVNKTAGTFTASIKDPDRAKAVAGAGIYLPKTNQAWGFFPGTTVGGSISLLTP